jgi:hypothetical protein
VTIANCPRQESMIGLYHGELFFLCFIGHVLQQIFQYKFQFMIKHITVK